MKTIHQCISAIAIALLASASATAQMTHPVAEVGVRFMPTVSSFDTRTVDNGMVQGTFVVGPGVGGFISGYFSDYVGVQAEVIYTSLAQKYEDAGLQRKIQISYVNVPLLLSLNTGKSKTVNLNVVAGPQMGFNVGSKITTEGGAQTDTLNAVLAVKRSDIGIAYGAGLDIGLNPAHTIRLGIGFRGVYGLVDISDHSKNITSDSYYVLDRTHVKTYSGYLGLSVLF